MLLHIWSGKLLESNIKIFSGVQLTVGLLGMFWFCGEEFLVVFFFDISLGNSCGDFFISTRCSSCRILLQMNSLIYNK